ncbi:UDP-N-acetylmuramate--L-alanine ligase [Desulfotalea psychrophila]|uniref:UDP-N-acetylmuramate--L-alanine ligase n=1 Tax=Desulfotalea psychrophila (strain LSv54 / DSM 12343) TaxID=177439 RepID=MURC_DESPS|nr:UDP-N-acetylmuramate--L-alanine ligase [Desulfotalea psychrophila]Q6AJ54.1 RecName: Full=UDP-N-acetylmuramate--L-alanine ligase; AltName: Full=UDP-N-acetylmuramoyl-L-alanine synthetase [Desulfotalea psychrophila LSv54]CAG37626.1 probable UDP-N-acetylmuramate-alanine ligase [Desulfotalea psychrophila LSv54]
MYRENHHIHFVGIGGIGMSGIAELLLHLGYSVSGSDLRSSATTKRLQDLGATIYEGHQAASCAGASVVVTSSAVAEDNPEVVQAREDKIPVIPRAEMLAELMRLKTFGIAVAGSHGKTSTTSLIGCLLSQTGFDPTIVVGGKVDSFGGNAKLGEGDFLVAEADESDGSFLKLSPVLEVVTNIDLEHLDYYTDIEHIKETFLSFIDKIPFYGAAIVCLDDENVAAILPQVQKRLITYGLTPQADVSADNLRFAAGRSTFRVRAAGEVLGEISVFPSGTHNVYNALAAVAIGLELEIPFGKIATALASFGGVQRRMQHKGEGKGITVIDDYAHHPTEIRASLKAIKETWPEKRLVVLFQPHRYSRTQALFEEFKTCFHQADCLIMTDIYEASESPIEGVSTEILLEAIKAHGQRYTRHIPEIASLATEVMPNLREGDLVVTLGAGNIVQAGEEICQLLGQE